MVYDLQELSCAIPAQVTEVSPPGPEGKPMVVKKRGYWHGLMVRCAIALALSLWILTLPHWWPKGAEFLRSQAGHGEIGITERAAQELISDVLSGEPLPEAFATFCQEVSHAGDSN
ncbi:MAG: hypothetical protein E7459_02125 [Ruminococcaceae bacterium]|nr:hypothetical protein [Oscillospiraceae bacterium]